MSDKTKTTFIKGHPKSGGLFIALADIAAFVLAFTAANALVPQQEGALPGLLYPYAADYERHFLYGFITLCVWSLFFSQGHYTQRIPWWNQVKMALALTCIGFLAEGFSTFVFEIHTSGWMILANWVFSFVLIILFRFFLFRIRANNTNWAIPSVAIGDSSTIADIIYAFNADPGLGYQLHTALLTDESNAALDPADLPRRYRNLQIETGYSEFETYIEEHPDNFYVVVLDNFRGIRRDRIVEAFKNSNAAYAIVPATARMSLYEMEPRYFFGFDVMLLHTKTSLSQPVSRFIKRTIDVVSSSAGLLVLAPLFGLIIAALKLEGHEGSIFYGGERVGVNGELFKCWKFRTMTPNSDHLLHEYLNANPEAKEHWEKYFKLPKDPRVKTRTAHLLRKASLDEIPQLWNVFCGNMSLVGPRPILPGEVESYGETISDYTKVRPGITGLWQVSGRNAVSFQRRVYWDSWYVRNWSLWGDIVIILKTIPAVLIRNDGH